VLNVVTMLGTINGAHQTLSKKYPVSTNTSFWTYFFETAEKQSAVCRQQGMWTKHGTYQSFSLSTEARVRWLVGQRRVQCINHNLAGNGGRPSAWKAEEDVPRPDSQSTAGSQDDTDSEGRVPMALCTGVLQPPDKQQPTNILQLSMWSDVC